MMTSFMMPSTMWHDDIIDDMILDVINNQLSKSSSQKKLEANTKKSKGLPKCSKDASFKKAKKAKRKLEASAKQSKSGKKVPKID